MAYKLEMHCENRNEKKNENATRPRGKWKEMFQNVTAQSTHKKKVQKKENRLALALRNSNNTCRKYEVYSKI